MHSFGAHWGGVSQVDIIEAWSYVSSGECLYYMPTSDILGYCVFDQVINLADSAATSAVKEEMASNLNGTGANYSVVSADVSDSDWFKGTPITPYYNNKCTPAMPLSIHLSEKLCRVFCTLLPDMQTCVKHVSNMCQT